MQLQEEAAPVESVCPRCHTAITSGAEGICPGCAAKRLDENERDEPSTVRSIADEALPRRFGQFELRSVIARGGMGVVYRAYDSRRQQIVALKRLVSGALAWDDERRRFDREARAAKSLAHPNIVPILEVGSEERCPYFTMPLVEGGDLAARIRRGAVDPREAARIVATVARAVHHGHTRLVIHRDLTPSNILFDSKGAPLVADFGIAKDLEEESMTASGEVLGKPGYMSPEQAAGSKQLTTATDIYSLGVILYELLTGRLPFAGATPREVLRHMLEDEPVAPRRVRPTIDRDLETLCLRCLNSEPDRRYASAEALAEDLDRYLADKPIAALQSWLWHSLRRWMRRHRVLALSLVALLFLTGILAGSALSLTSTLEAALVDEALRANAESARRLALLDVYELERLGRIVTRIAADPDLARLLETGGTDGRLQVRLGELADSEYDFFSWTVQDARGIMRARVPDAPEIVGRDFAFRDYFRGAAERTGRDGIDAVHVSRAFTSAIDGRSKAALSVSIRRRVGQRVIFLGVLAADMTTRARLGPLAHSVLAARAEDSEGEGYRILVHPAYSPEELASKLGQLGRLQLSPPSSEGSEIAFPGVGSTPERPVVILKDYRDPVERRRGEAHRSLAAVAPVGNTELVAVVQTPYDDVVGTKIALTRKQMAWQAAALALLLASIGVGVGVRKRGN